MPLIPPAVAAQAADTDQGLVANALSDAPVTPIMEGMVPPPPPPGGELTPDQLMTVASAPPPAFPQTDVDAALAPYLAQQGGPALALVPPPQSEAPKTPDEAAQQNLAAAKELGAEGVKNAEERTDLDQKAADEKAAFQAAHVEALKALQERQELHRQAAEANVAEARAKAETQPYHTLWETRNTGEKVAIGIGLLLGGVSWNANHVNRGAEMLDRAIEHDLTLQRERHKELWHAVELAQQGVTALDSSQLRETARFSAMEGAKYDAVAGRIGAMIAANKGRSDVTEAKKKALEYSEKATEAWKNAANAEATANHLSQIDKETAARDAELQRHHQEQERTAALRAAKYKTKGGGGGGGGSARESASLELKDKISELQKSGLKGIDLDKAIDREAVRLKIPLTGKPNTLNARQIKADLLKEASGEARAEGLDLKHDEAEANKIVRFDGKPAAIAGSAKIAAKAADDDVARGDAITRLKELAHDIKTKGGKIDPTDPNAVQERVSKFANAIIAIGIVSPLGKTNETLHLETKALGIPGVPDWEHLTESLRQYVTTNGANLANVERKIEETIRNREAHRAKFQPLTDEQKKKYGGPGSTAKPGELPPGAIPGTQKSTGKRGYMLNGKFTPLEADIVL